VTHHSLPESGPERQIFLQALKRFSDECEPPDLIAECPFSIDLPEGGRGCGEECLEILGHYGVPRSAGGVPIGTTGIAAHSMGRPRRPQSYAGSLKPFDAAELFYRDSDDPDRTGWHTVSLIKDITEAYVPDAVRRPDTDRCKKLAASSDELARRGFDVDTLLRNGLRLPMAYGLAMAIGMPNFVDTFVALGETDPETAERERTIIRGWGTLLDAFLEIEGSAGQKPLTPDADDSTIAVNRWMAALTGPFNSRLRIWAAIAPIDDLINRQPPTTEEFLAIDLGREPAIRAEGRRPRWLIDRFTETYLRNWNAESLKLEWRYHQGSVDLPCARREMAARSVDTNALARALAEAAANPASDGRVTLLQTAVQLLRQGRRDTAAAVYDAARQEQWDDPILHNNYGFCLLPDYPTEALAALELAASFGVSGTVNVCNRMLALFMLGRHAAALELADRAVEGWDELDIDLSYLWDFIAPEPTLLARQCPRCYLVKLAAHVADASGDDKAAARWSDVESRLRVHGH
jgi:hypothetical protein